MKLKIEVELDIPLDKLLKEVARALTQPATAELLWHYDKEEGFVMEQKQGKIEITKL